MNLKIFSLFILLSGCTLADVQITRETSDLEMKRLDSIDRVDNRRMMKSQVRIRESRQLSVGRLEDNARLETRVRLGNVNRRLERDTTYTDTITKLPNEGIRSEHVRGEEYGKLLQVGASKERRENSLEQNSRVIQSSERSIYEELFQTNREERQNIRANMANSRIVREPENHQHAQAIRDNSYDHKQVDRSAGHRENERKVCSTRMDENNERIVKKRKFQDTSCQRNNNQADSLNGELERLDRSRNSIRQNTNSEQHDRNEREVRSERLDANSEQRNVQEFRRSNVHRENSRQREINQAENLSSQLERLDRIRYNIRQDLRRESRQKNQEQRQNSGQYDAFRRESIRDNEKEVQWQRENNQKTECLDRIRNKIESQYDAFRRESIRENEKEVRSNQMNANSVRRIEERKVLEFQESESLDRIRNTMRQDFRKASRQESQERRKKNTEQYINYDEREEYPDLGSRERDNKNEIQRNVQHRQRLDKQVLILMPIRGIQNQKMWPWIQRKTMSYLSTNQLILIATCLIAAKMQNYDKLAGNWLNFRHSIYA